MHCPSHVKIGIMPRKKVELFPSKPGLGFEDKSPTFLQVISISASALGSETVALVGLTVDSMSRERCLLEKN